MNLAIDSARQGRTVTLVDLDLVNPYFRSSDYKALLEGEGITVVSPIFAGTTLDNPSISGAIYAVIDAASENGNCVIIDVGGDDVGATALGRFAKNIEAQDHRMYYVINRYRNLTQTPQEAAALLPEIERKSHMKAHGVINNSHLQYETTDETVVDALGFGEETAGLLGLPLVCTTIPETLVHGKTAASTLTETVKNGYAVSILVRTPW
ncbi:MAG: CpsD/CapB family tyrosine-protein kinase [Actinobacteria bacterium]|nr:CpsD/CapB family tyrosine-protein kinase [Actinomycetota bacterium]